MAVRGSEPPEGAIIPHLVVPDAGQAGKFYEAAFGAVMLFRSRLRPEPANISTCGYSVRSCGSPAKNWINPTGPGVRVSGFTASTWWVNVCLSD
jgi:hypothetical protein